MALFHIFPSQSMQAYELSTLTGTQVMLLVASETGHVYTFATRKLQPMITSEAGKALIQTCLNSPDPAGSSGGGQGGGAFGGRATSSSGGGGDQRMSATGYEETELTYNIAGASADEEQGQQRVRHLLYRLRLTMKYESFPSFRQNSTTHQKTRRTSQRRKRRSPNQRTRNLSGESDPLPRRAGSLQNLLQDRSNLQTNPPSTPPIPFIPNLSGEKKGNRR